MGLLKKVKRALAYEPPDLLKDSEERADYRCIRCGADLVRGHHNCPECGKPYVAYVGDEEE